MITFFYIVYDFRLSGFLPRSKVNERKKRGLTSNRLRVNVRNAECGAGDAWDFVYTCLVNFVNNMVLLVRAQY